MGYINNFTFAKTGAKLETPKDDERISELKDKGFLGNSADLKGSDIIKAEEFNYLFNSISSEFTNIASNFDNVYNALNIIGSKSNNNEGSGLFGDVYKTLKSYFEKISALEIFKQTQEQENNKFLKYKDGARGIEWKNTDDSIEFQTKWDGDKVSIRGGNIEMNTGNTKEQIVDANKIKKWDEYDISINNLNNQIEDIKKNFTNLTLTPSPKSYRQTDWVKCSYDSRMKAFNYTFKGQSGTINGEANEKLEGFRKNLVIKLEIRINLIDMKPLYFSGDSDLHNYENGLNEFKILEDVVLYEDLDIISYYPEREFIDSQYRAKYISLQRLNNDFGFERLVVFLHQLQYGHKQYKQNDIHREDYSYSDVTNNVEIRVTWYKVPGE